MKRPDILKMIADIAALENYDIVPELAYSQFVHETGNFSSRLFLEGNNVSGMKASSRNIHTGIFDNPEKSATYDNIYDSVLDYIKRLKQTVNGNTPVVPYADPKQFYDEMFRTKYNPSKKYPELLLQVHNSYFPNGATTSSRVVKSLSKVAKGSLWVVGSMAVACVAACVWLYKKYIT